MSRANRARRAANTRYRAAAAPAAQRRPRQEYLADSHARVTAADADPALAAMRAAKLDTEAVALIEAARPAQEGRLRAGRWVRRWDGVDGLGCWDHYRWGLRLMHSASREDDGQVWAHVSLSRRDGAFPAWLEAERVHWLLYPEHPGVIVVAPQAAHVNLREVAHVWVKLTGDPPVPDFTSGTGSI